MTGPQGLMLAAAGLTLLFCASIALSLSDLCQSNTCTLGCQTSVSSPTNAIRAVGEGPFKSED